MLIAYCLGCGKELERVAEDYCPECEDWLDDDIEWNDDEDWDDEEDDPFIFMPEDF